MPTPQRSICSRCSSKNALKEIAEQVTKILKIYGVIKWHLTPMSYNPNRVDRSLLTAS